MTTPPADRSRPDPAAPTLRVDLSSPVPPYEQVREQLAGLITIGDLRPGRRLPPVRQLAADLGLAPGTVARAYRELEQDALVEGRGRRGTLVRASPRRTADAEERHQALTDAARRLAALAHDLDLADETVLAAVRTALSGRSARA